MDFGRDYSFKGKIYPFRDRPDVAIDVLWFPVPLDSPYVPYPNPFVLRNWDRLEQLPQTQLGTDQFIREKWLGPRPLNTPGTPCGTADEWQNGLLYSRWIADGYACSCPEPIYMTVVNSVRCDDGSLVISPNTDDVEAHINVSHDNHWLVTQFFKAAFAGFPAASFQPFTGFDQVALQIVDTTGTLRAEYKSVDSGATWALRCYDSSGNLRVNLTDDGSLFLENASGSHIVDLRADNDSTFIVGGSWLWSSPGVIRVDGQMQMGRGSTMVAPATTSATLQVAAPGSGDTLAFSVGDQSSGTFVPTFEVFDEIAGVTPAHVQINGSGPGFRYGITVQYTEPMGGVAIQPLNSAAGTNDPFTISDPSGIPRFVVDHLFQLSSSGITGTAGPPGVAGYKLQWTDLNTGLTWYIPLYPAF